MQLIMDESRETIAATSVAAAIEHGAQQAERAGRCVVEVHVDGALLTCAELDASDTASRSADEVRLVTAQRSDVAHDTLRDAALAIDAIDTTQREAAEFMQCDQLSDAMNMLKEAIASWLQVQDAASKACAMAGIDLESFETDQVAAADVIERLSGHLTVIADALRTSDTILLSDVLLYEFPDTMTDWRHLLASLAEQCGEHDGENAPCQA